MLVLELLLFSSRRPNMLSTQYARFISSTNVAVAASKANLAKLRKKTGYPFGNCKKALEASNNDLEKAEKWLEEQAKALGWSKAMKMESRNTPQGLIGIAWDKQYAAMVEVNCETDFVSKNDKFQRLVDVVARTCLQQTKTDNPSPTSISKVVLEGEEVGKLVAPDQQNLADLVIKNVGVIGERLVVRRAALVSAPPSTLLSVLTHPAASPTNLSSMLGKYGAVLMYSQASGDSSAHLAKQLCQHVIGMNPLTIEAPPGAPEPVRVEKPTEVKDEEVEGTDSVEEDESAMLRQKFLLDVERTVADVVNEAGITVVDFVRFECGEGVGEQHEDTTRVAQASG